MACVVCGCPNFYLSLTFTGQNKKQINCTGERPMNTKINSIMLLFADAVRRRFVGMATFPLAFLAAGLLAGCEHQTYFNSAVQLKAQPAQTGGLTTKTNESIS